MNENQLQTLLNAINTLQDLGKVAYFNKGNFNSQTEYEINDVVSYNGSSYVSLVNNNRGNLPTNTAFWSIVASKGEKGDTGKAFVIEKTYSTIEDMVDDYDNMNINDYVMIQGSIEEQENATLWTKTETEVSPYKWVYLADFSGASGITGATPNIQIGMVTEGNQPSVTRRAGSTNENPILDFVLKTGAKGDTGATGNGISSVSKTGTSGLTDIYTIAYTNGGSDTFNVANGKGIVSIQKTGSVDTVDTYTITYNDGTTSTFEVTNGEVSQAQLDETNKEVERANMVYNALPKVSGEGTDITLDNTAECPVYDIELKGNTSQYSTTGKNLFAYPYKDTTASPKNANGVIWTDLGDGRIKVNGTPTGLSTFDFYAQTTPLTVKPNTTYTIGIISSDINLRFSFIEYDSNNTLVASHDNVTIKTFTTSATTTRLTGGIKRNVNNTAINNVIIEPMLIEGSYTSETFPTYEEFTGGQPSPSPDFPQDIHVVSGDNTITISNSDNTQIQTYPLPLGNLEYCKIGDYENIFFKNVAGSEYYDSTLQVGKWYLKKNVEKVVLNGSESNWEQATSIVPFRLPISNVMNPISDSIKPIALSNYYEVMSWDNALLDTIDYALNIKGYTLRFKNTNINTLNDFKNWLSSHNTIVYYLLQTPTYILLNNTLQTQLENIQNAISYEQQTNVSQVNDDLPFVIKMSAIRDLSGIFEEI